MNTPQKHWQVMRIVVVAGLIVGLIALHCQLSRISSAQFIAKMKHAFTQKAAYIGLGTAGALVLGASFIIYKVTRGKGKMWGDHHMQPVYLKHLKNADISHQANFRYQKECYADTSYLNSKGNGTVPVTWRKGNYNDFCSDHDLIASSILLAAPIQTVGSIAYNTLRLIVMPFYIMGRIYQEKGSQRPLFGARKFEWMDIVRETGNSLKNIALAPFYGTAYLISGLYAFIDPFGGRKLGRLVCEEWMGGIERQHSLWPCGGEISSYRSEFSGGPELLNNHAFYWTGCWMKQAVLEVEGYEIKRAHLPDCEEVVFTVYSHNEEIPSLTLAEHDGVLEPGEWRIKGTEVVALLTDLEGKNRSVSFEPKQGIRSYSDQIIEQAQLDFLVSAEDS
ncbi:MAG: hypothetical protein H7A36_04820 [Chlamydiales bacterium]|nr:hypothetical protein [Chlamydiales bacterium]